MSSVNVSLNPRPIVLGSCIKEFTPEERISCCRVTADGNALVYGLSSSMTLKTLLLNKTMSSETSDSSRSDYGDKDNEGMVFDFSA